MDKHKLIQIIEKELEELKVITAEVSENEKDSGLIIEIALGKARVLCNEIELLRTFSAKEESGDDANIDDELNEPGSTLDIDIADPELEIAGPEDENEMLTFSIDESDETDIIEDDENEDTFEDNDIIDEDDDLVDDEDLDDEDNETDESQDQEEELIEFEHDDSLTANDNEVSEQTFDKSEPQHISNPKIREITLGEIEDEPFHVKQQPISKAAERPVFREIPKPEEPTSGEKGVTETINKGQTLNDSIGETKVSETKLNTGPISSLKASIGLNDRYQFVREIFGNNTEKYNKVIDHLDKLETIQQAVEYLKSQLTLQKTETSMKFVELLKRRFTK